MKEDWLYTHWAVKHLLAIDKAIRELSEYSNLTLNDSILALYRERKKLIRTDPNFARAEKFLEEMTRHGLIRKLGDVYCGTLQYGEEEVK